MTLFTVESVTDGDTFTVANGWSWDGKSGEYIRPLGYDTPEKGQPGYEAAKAKLVNLIQGKQVDVRDPASVDVYGRLLAHVYYNGVNLVDHFPEYKK